MCARVSVHACVHACVRDVFAIYDNNILPRLIPRLIMIIMRGITNFDTQVALPL